MTSIKILHNGRILTMDPDRSVKDSMAFHGEEIVAVGDHTTVRQSCETLATQSEPPISIEEQDLEGKTVLPGFIDAHMHPMPYIYFKLQTDLSQVKSFADLEHILKEASAQKGDGEWLLAMDLMEDTFTDPAERRFPTKKDLDRYVSDHPVIVLRHDGHICAVNSRVLDTIGITAGNVGDLQPEGGEIQLDSRGEPTGILKEEAKNLALDILPAPDPADLQDAARQFSVDMARLGITCCGGIVQEGEKGFVGKLGALDIPMLQLAIKQGLIHQDLGLYVSTERPKKLLRLQKSFRKLDSRPARFEVLGLKLFADGTFGASTAYMFEPFSDAEGDNRGFMVETEEYLYRMTKEASDLGFQVVTHAIGDKGNKVMVDIYRRVLEGREESRTNKLRLEHASMLREDVLDEIERLGIVVVSQPVFITSEYTWLSPRLGDRIRYTYNFRSILDRDILLAGASDAPVESASVLKAIFACVTRHGFVPEESITALEAIAMYTCNAAQALGQEAIRGALEPGKLADLVVLDRDPREVNPDEIPSIRVLETIHRGETIYRLERE